MKLQFAPSLLLSILQITSTAAFAPPSSFHATIPSCLHSYNDVHYNHEHYDDNEYYNEQHSNSLYNEPNVDFSRRDTTGAFFRGLTAAGAVAAGSAVMRPWNANAAEFSDGGIPSSLAFSPPAPVANAPPAAAAKASSSPSFKLTPLKTPARSNTASSIQYKNSLAEMDSSVLAAGAITAAGFVGVASTLPNSQEGNWDKADDKQSAATPASSASPPPPKEEKPWFQPPIPYGIANKDQNPFINQSTSTIPSKIAGAPPPLGAAPYGLASGRNYWDNKVLNTADSLPRPPPPPKAVTPPPPPVVDTAQDADKPWYQPPTPYGLINKSNNPFLKDIQQYCEPGKVSDPCTESIKGYLNDLSNTGEAASGEAAGTIVSYLDSLGGKTTPAGVSAAPSARVVKEALLTPPSPSEAEVVKEYLDALNIAKRPVSTGMVMEAPPKSKSTAGGEYRVYEERLTSIETRVDSLEKRVDGLPDEVFQRMEEWRLAQENKWGASQWAGGMSGGSGSGAGGGYASPPPPSPKKLKVIVRNAPRSTGMGGYLESLNP
jgi:hypothetical protein